MKWSFPGGCALLLMSAAWCMAQQPAPPAENPLKTVRDRVSYGIGVSIGENLKADGLDVDIRLLAQGLADALAGRQALQTEEQFRDAMLAYQKALEDKTLADNKAFLDANAKVQGVKVLPSGLQYAVIRAGNGKRPTPKDTVKAHYHGTFINGKVFDSSYERMEPAEFPLDGVIRGWTEGVPLMQVGAKYRFWIPADLAYGPRGRPGIPPQSVLIFDIELLDVIAAPEGVPPRP